MPRTNRLIDIQKDGSQVLDEARAIDFNSNDFVVTVNQSEKKASLSLDTGTTQKTAIPFAVALG